jgi:hypothetical protein
VGTILDTITTYADGVTGNGGWDNLAAASGEALSIRWFEEGTKVTLLDAWGGNNAHKCDFNIHSPLMHDNTYGWRFSYEFNPTLSGADGNPQIFLPPYYTQPLVPTDTLTVQTLATASDDVTLTLAIMYDTPSIQGGRFATAEEVKARGKNLFGNRISPAAATSTSTYGTAEAINSDDDRFKANTDYALIGAHTDLPATTLIVYGPDTANFHIPMPLSWDATKNVGYFYDLSRRLNKPLIPVINSNNKGVTFSQLADVGGGTAPLITLQWVELAA